MAPLDTFNSDGQLAYPAKLDGWLSSLANGQVDGLMVDVWWGLTEPSESTYRWSGYQSLFAMCASHGLRVVPVMSFHQCGGNVGDSVTILLPSFLLSSKAFFMNQTGGFDIEYLSFAYDTLSVSPSGRTPIQMYRDFMQSFSDQFASFIANGTIAEIEIGMGPCGELRFPSYQSWAGWSYPGCGTFQTFDIEFSYQLVKDAVDAGVPAYGRTPIVDPNATPGSAGFWADGTTDAWDSAYGQWFLAWYAEQLIVHGDRVLEQARAVFGQKVRISGKIAGIHWWYLTACHCAENVAGLKDSWSVDGYRDIMAMFEKYNVDVCFTCLEMTPDPAAGSNPGWLVQQVIDDSAWAGLRFEGENALDCYGQDAYDRIVAWVAKGLVRFSYLRLGDTLMEPGNWAVFTQFVKNIHDAKKIK
jgi:beta-amylase